MEDQRTPSQLSEAEYAAYMDSLPGRVCIECGERFIPPLDADRVCEQCDPYEERK